MKPLRVLKDPWGKTPQGKQVSKSTFALLVISKKSDCNQQALAGNIRQLFSQKGILGKPNAGQIVAPILEDPVENRTKGKTRRPTKAWEGHQNVMAATL